MAKTITPSAAAASAWRKRIDLRLSLAMLVQMPQRFGPGPKPEFRPEISGGDHSPRDQAECDAGEKSELRLDKVPPIEIPAIADGRWQKRTSCGLTPQT